MLYELMKLTDKNLSTKEVKYQVVKRFNDEERQYIDNCITNVNYFQTFAFSWFAISNNLKDLKILVDEYAFQYKETLSGSRDKVHYVTKVAEVVKSVSNFLSSANLFLALLEKNSSCEETKEKWVNEKRDMHANHLCYRLCYELRNHSQHAGLPVSGVQANNIGSNDVHGEIYLDREVIISDSKSTKKLKKYIHEYDGDVSLIPIFDDYLSVVSKLFVYFLELNMQYYKSIPEFFEQYSQYTDQRSSLIYVSNKVPDDEILSNMTRLQLGTFEWVLDITKQCHELKKT
ncbi:TPA: hypothetical protein ACPJ12_004673 [Vibrio diabolicus]|uniref:hypothetical protein n=1 Tax=Vibrio diabolicus TaxID=50719 RepID=UPI00215E184D|nr:hypothetical protein [Vibrio diabolicus]MCS0395200.1 hypothetical protein [Vibrio diabolicus]